MKRFADVYRAIGLLGCLSVVALAAGATLQHLSKLPAGYTWLEPIRTLRLVFEIEWFPTAIVGTYALGVIRRGGLDAVRARLGVTIEVTSFVRQARRPAACALALAVADALLFPKHNIIDVGAMLVVGAVVGLRRFDRTTSLKFIGHVVFAAIAFSCVCYFYTVLKALTFVGRSPADDLLLTAERAVFGVAPHRAIASWAATRPALVALCDWVYFHFFQHMTLTTVLLLGMARHRERSEYLGALALCYLIGGPLYHVLPSMGPGYHDPDAYAFLVGKPLIANDIRMWLYANTAGVVQGKASDLRTWGYIACMPSLHIAHELVMLYYARHSRIAFAAAFVFAVLTCVSVVVLGWHYPIDALGAVGVAGVAIGVAKWQRDWLMPAFLAPESTAPPPTTPREREPSSEPSAASPTSGVKAGSFATYVTSLSPIQKAVFAVTGVALVVYLPSVLTGFVYDDNLLIVQNEYVHAWRWVPRAFSTHFWDVSRVADAVETRRYYRPLVTLSYLGTWMLVGARAWVFHLTNVLLHAASGALATRAIRRWTGSTFWSVAIGLAFTLHPSRTENVIWISGRTDLLMMVFLLGALDAFAAYERERVAAPRRARIALAVGVACVIGGILSKEPAAMVPLLLLAEAAVRRTDQPRVDRTPLVVSSLICGAYLLVRALVYPPEVDVHRTFTPLHALMTVGAYVQRAVLPWPPTMYYHAIVYDETGPVYPTSLLVVGAVATTATVVALVLAWRRARTAFWLLLASVAFMGPLLNVYFTGLNVSAQDRFLYAPLLFGLGAVAVLFERPLTGFIEERAARLLLGGCGVAWVCIVAIRTPDYRTDDTLWEAELAHNPSHPYVLQMVAQTAARRGDLATAYDYFERAEAPDARKYRFSRDANAHFQQAVVLAALLPDGQATALRLLLDELWRVVDPTFTPPRTTVLGYDVGGPVPELARLANNKAFYWDVALIATRLGDLTRAEQAVAKSSVNAALASANPLNDALALARLGHIDEATAMSAQVRQRSTELGSLASERDLDTFDARLRRARQVAGERDQAPSSKAKAGFEALRLAELGAYLAALRVLDASDALDQPESAAVVMQLLVACRLEDAARDYALRNRLTTANDVSAVIAGIRAELPPRLREMPAVPGDLARAMGRPR